MNSSADSVHRRTAASVDFTSSEASRWDTCWFPCLTHDPQSPSTTFHFVTDGPEAAHARAKEAAAGKDVGIGGGVSFIRRYLAADLIDELHLAMSPVLFGEGEDLFSGINLSRLGFLPYRAVGGKKRRMFCLEKIGDVCSRSEFPHSSQKRLECGTGPVRPLRA